MQTKNFSSLVIFFALLFLISCDALPLPGAPTPVNTVTYDTPISFNIKAGSILPGTSIAYQGKTETGSAKVMLSGLPAPKQTADSVDWDGVLSPNVTAKLALRVASFDAQSITLAGTAHIEVKSIDVKPGGTAGKTLVEFDMPVVTYQLDKNKLVPGTNLAYAGSTPDGAQFIGVEGYPYRKQFDSLQYVGHIAPKVFLRLDLRILNFSESSVTLAGPARLVVENP